MSLYHLKSFWYYQHEVSPQDLNTENICQFSSIEHRIKLYFITYLVFHSLSGASLVAQTVKNLPANSGDTDLIPESGRSPGEGNGNPLQYSCLGNSIDRETRQTIVHGVTKSQTQLSDWACRISLTNLILHKGLKSQNMFNYVIVFSISLLVNFIIFCDSLTSLMIWDIVTKRGAKDSEIFNINNTYRREYIFFFSFLKLHISHREDSRRIQNKRFGKRLISTYL